ncbi:Ig-like domain (group 3) [Bryocella elongata]|uniref:Ig-like domain (Group 3) n=1 Tax=Bryocella elongata TaxID=863522 RepID=A0A1H5ZPR5_9BACT|nr:Ig-like domain (group 3) [Bryocella elongata]
MSVLSPVAAFSQVADSLRPAVVPVGVADLGSLPAAQSVTLTVHLAPSEAHEAALEQFVSDVETTGSSSWHRWVTPAQFAQSYGPDANAVAAVTTFAQANGLSVGPVSASGTRVALTGTVTQVEAAFAASLHSYATGSTTYYANSSAVKIPAALRAYAITIDGFSNAPSAYPLTLSADGVASTANDVLAALATVVEANTARVVTLDTAACAEDFDTPTRSALELALREAVAQGITVLAAAECGTRGAAGLPSIFPEITSVALGAGLTPTTSTDALSDYAGLRPSWQVATGLPSDALRHEPDVTASSLADFASTMQTILAREPANPDGTAARLGNIAGTMYALRMTPGLYTQPDDASSTNGAVKVSSASAAVVPASSAATATASGKWEAATGLGVVSMAQLAKVFPAGASSNNVQITIDNPGAAHGQNITFTANVTNTSGNSSLATPTGTINFALNTGASAGSGSLTNGTYSVTTNQLAAGNYTVAAQYSGDANYAQAVSVTDSFSVSAEASNVGASAPASTAVGQMIAFTVTDSSPSGVGTPSGTVTVIPQYLASPPTYTGTLSGSGGTATATVQVPATQAGYLAFKVNCVSADPSFTCYNPINVSANVIKGTATMTLAASPSNPAAGTSVTFTATVSGPGSPYPTPTGSVTVYDYATAIGTAQLNSSGVATITVSSVTGSYHSFSANYAGDGNYNTANATAGSTTGSTATSTALSVNPNPPVGGSTTNLTATLTYTSGSSAPTGSMSFYEDGALLGTAALSGATATYSSTAISGTTTHTFYAVYSGDANFQTSQSPVITTSASGSGGNTTTGTLTVNPNPPVGGNTTTLIDTIHYTSPSGTSTTPSGTVTFYEDGVSIGSNGVNGGSATFTSTTISGKTAHTFNAIYAGDNTFSGNTSNSVTTAASTAGTSVSIAANPTVVATGSTTTLTATVNSTTGGTAPTGTVTFSSSLQGTLGTANLAGNTATLTPTLTAAGSQSITATYNGDGNYNSQASTSPVTVTVGPAAAVTIAVAPTTATYGQTLTLSATATGTATSGTGPSGTVNLTLYGTATVTASIQLSPTSSTTATGTTTIVAPSVGSYNIQATCTGTTFNCSNVQITAAQLTVGKAATTTALTSNPTNPTAGQSVTYTATVASSTTSSTATAPTGNVTFSNGTTTTTVTLTGNVATWTTTAVSGATVTATYNGDGNYSSSNSTGSTGGTTPAAPPVASTTALISSSTSGLADTLVLLTATVTDAPSTANPTPGAPIGTVTFYDTRNGVTVSLGTVTVTTTGSYTATAQLSTTGLASGSHSVTAVFSGGTNTTGSTSNAVTIGFSDYTLSFSPSSLTLTRGKSGSSTLTVTAVNGFNGTVALACVAPSGTSTTCSFTPTAISGSGISTLVITTQQGAELGGGLRAQLEGRAGGIAAASLLLGCLLPGVRRRRPALFLIIVASLAMFSSTGCTTLTGAASGGTGLGSGTPTGALSFIISTTGTQAGASTNHDTTFSVTVQ